MSGKYTTREQILERAEEIIGKTLRSFVPAEEIDFIEGQLSDYGTRRKGFLGDLVEMYLYDKRPDQRSEADFSLAGIELKTTPLKRLSDERLVAKERLVFSMIDYDRIKEETWEGSSFLKKNALTLLLFYLYERDKGLLDRLFIEKYLLDLLNGLTAHERAQIKRDWEAIAAKVKRNEAHLLSEADTMYLAACTKGRDSLDVRDTGNGPAAKRRAFSLKKKFMDRLIEREVLHGAHEEEGNALDESDPNATIEATVAQKLARYIEKNDLDLADKFEIGTDAKNWRVNLIVKILTGKNVKKVEELEKANVTMKVITLESTGTLKESISFPAFDYISVAETPWYVEAGEDVVMAEIHRQLDEKKFLFVVFQKSERGDHAALKGAFFWNFPQKDLPEAQKVYETTQTAIKDVRYDELPKLSGSKVMHVRTHGKNNRDTSPTPQGGQEVKRSFWLNAGYIRQVVKEELGI